jgi:hypothetical protein
MQQHHTGAVDLLEKDLARLIDKAVKLHGGNPCVLLTTI